MTESTVLHVGGAAPYDVVVGHDLADRLARHPRSRRPARAPSCTPARLGHLAETVLAALVDHYDVLALGLPDGEDTKTASVANDCWEALGAKGFTRPTPWSPSAAAPPPTWAASWPRPGCAGSASCTSRPRCWAWSTPRWAARPASTPAPARTWSAPSTSRPGCSATWPRLRTLPRDELVAGLGEVIKCGFIADPVILDLVEGTEPDAITADSPVLRELVERAIRVKIDVVVEDLKETGGRDGHPGREALNYGHTLAHAIERAEDYGIRHGEAVAIGCVFVAELARRAGLIDEALAERHRSAFGRVGLPTSYDAASFEDLHATMKVDKKSRGSQLRFVVLGALARPQVLAGPSEDDLRASYASLSTGGAA